MQLAAICRDARDFSGGDQRIRQALSVRCLRMTSTTCVDSMIA